MIKRIACVLMAALLLCCTGCAEPADRLPDTQGEPTPQTVVTQPEELAQIAARDGTKAPAGYSLEKVETYLFDESLHVLDPQLAWPYLLLYEVRDCSGCLYEFYRWEDVCSADWFEGPCQMGVTFTGPASAAVDAQTRAARSAAAPYEESGSFSAAVPEGKCVEVRTYIRYRVMTFDLYNRLTDKCVEQDVWIAMPTGIAAVQYTYGRQRAGKGGNLGVQPVF